MTRSLVLYGLFLISGACGLIYQVVWSKVLGHLFGSTVLAVSTVLAAFMTGLALGGWLLGRYGDRSERPLSLYGWFEIGIGLSALLSIGAMDQLTPLYVWLNRALGSGSASLTIARFAIAAALIIVPTSLMGATLPIVTRAVMRGFATLGRSVSRLYAINTLGALTGAALAGFFLIGRFGIHRTVYLAVALNIAVGLAAQLLSRFTPAGTIVEPEPAEPTAPATSLAKGPAVAVHGPTDGCSGSAAGPLLWAIGISGFTSFVYEVVWTRALVFVVGNSTYAFVMMLSAFLLGLAIGGHLIGLVADRLRDPMRAFGLIQLAIGASAASAVPLLVFLLYSERGTALVLRWVRTAHGPSFAPFLTALVVMLVPTILIGTTFPLAGRIFVRELERASADLGALYAVNTAGNILGTLAPAFVLVPVFGINKTILAMAALNVTVGLVLLTSRTRARAVWLGPLVFAALAGLVAVLPLELQLPTRMQQPEDRVWFYDEGISATTKVFVQPESRVKMISVDGVIIGGTGFTDKKQQILAHLPKLLLPRYASELSVGLGSGILAGESARHPGIERLVVVELAPSVRRGAARFEAENFGVLNDHRVEIVLDDGVNYLLMTDERFDIISTDGKAQPDHAGNGVFYSADYYALMRDHLTATGAAIQWIPTHVPPADYRMIVATFARAFPHVSLWFVPPSDSFMLGSTAPLEIDPNEVQRRFRASEDVLTGLRKYGITSADALLAHFVAERDRLLEVTEHERSNSLEHPYYEFYDPRQYAVSSNQRTHQNLRWLLSFRASLGERPWTARVGGEAARRLELSADAELDYLRGLEQFFASGSFTAEVQRSMGGAVERAPFNDDVRFHLSSQIERVARVMALTSRDKAERMYRRALDADPGHGLAGVGLADLLTKRGELGAAWSALEGALSRHPRLVAARSRLVQLALETGRYQDGAPHAEVVLAADHDDVRALACLGLALAARDAADPQALEHVTRAYQKAPADPYAIDARAWVSHRRGDGAEAAAIVERSGHYHHGAARLGERRQVILEGR